MICNNLYNNNNKQQFDRIRVEHRVLRDKFFNKFWFPFPPGGGALL